MEQVPLKQDVRDFWNKASCGEIHAQSESERQYREEHSRQRYALEPYIYDFARFEEGCGRDLLEGSVGQRHQGALLTIAKRLWPRELLKNRLPNHSLMLLIEAT